MAVAIITDSAASLPPDLAASGGVTVVALRVSVGGRECGAARPHPQELLAWLDDGVVTSSPSPGQFAAAIRERLTGDGVLVLTVARSMSSTYQAARLAAARTPGRVEVLDTGTAAGGQGLVVLAAAQAARRGEPLAGVLAAARRAAERVRLVATVPTLDQLVRSGRLPASMGWAGARLGIQPMFEFRAGRIRPLRPAFSPEAARERILARWWASRPPGADLHEADLHVAALHALAPDAAKQLLEGVYGRVEPATAFVGEFDLAMVAHTGPGVTGLAWWWEPAG